MVPSPVSGSFHARCQVLACWQGPVTPSLGGIVWLNQAKRFAFRDSGQERRTDSLPPHLVLVLVLVLALALARACGRSGQKRSNQSASSNQQLTMPLMMRTASPTAVAWKPMVA